MEPPRWEDIEHSFFIIEFRDVFSAERKKFSTCSRKGGKFFPFDAKNNAELYTNFSYL